MLILFIYLKLFSFSFFFAIPLINLTFEIKEIIYVTECNRWRIDHAKFKCNVLGWTENNNNFNWLLVIKEKKE